MDLIQIRYFWGLADELHFWRAADKLNITQSALSRHIKGMEEELGFLVFERTKRKVELTAAGQFMRQEWQRLLPTIDTIQRQAQQISRGEMGTFRIGHPGSITHSVLPGLLLVLTKTYPELQVELLEVNTIDVEQILLSHQIDLGFRREPAVSQLLAFSKVSTESFALVVPTGHPMQNAAVNGLGLVKEAAFILPSLARPTQYATTLRNIFGQYGFQPKVVVESEFGATILSLVAQGLGLSVMPLSYASGSPTGVRFLPLPDQTSLFMLWRKHDHSPMLHNALTAIETMR
ncbi:LysR family transcriptional regulator [Spirosoma arcticum]